MKSIGKIIEIIIKAIVAAENAAAEAAQAELKKEIPNCRTPQDTFKETLVQVLHEAGIKQTEIVNHAMSTAIGAYEETYIDEGPKEAVRAAYLACTRYFLGLPYAIFDCLEILDNGFAVMAFKNREGKYRAYALRHNGLRHDAADACRAFENERFRDSITTTWKEDFAIQFPENVKYETPEWEWFSMLMG